MFISFYNTIYFFAKKFIFSTNTVLRMSLYFFFLLFEKGAISSVRTKRSNGGGWWGLGVGSYKSVQLRSGRRGVTPHVYIALTCLFMLWQDFCLIVPCFICRNLTLPIFKKDVFLRNTCFSPTRSVSAVLK